MALNYAEKMKAEAPTPRQTLIHDLVQEFSMPLRNLGFNDRRDAAFRWIAQSLQTILDPRPIIKRSTSTTAQQTTWLKDTAPLDPAWTKRVQHSYKLLIDTLSAYPECLKVSRGPATIAPIDLVMMTLLVFEFHEKLSPPRLADALHALRMAARKETKDLMWKGEHMGFYLVFLDRLERLGEGALNSGGGKDSDVAMDVDPPSKRQRTGGMYRTSQHNLEHNRSLTLDARLHTDVRILPSVVCATAPTEYKHSTAHISQQAKHKDTATATAATSVTTSDVRRPRHTHVCLYSSTHPRFQYVYTHLRDLSCSGTGHGGPRDARVDARLIPVSASA